MSANSDSSPILKATPEGVPEMFIYKSGTMLRGWEIAIDSSSPGAKVTTKILPQLAFEDENYKGEPPPVGLNVSDIVVAELKIVAIFPKHTVSAIEYGHRDDYDGRGQVPVLFKVIQSKGNGWESPRAPYKVSVQLHAKYVLPQSSTTIECLGDGGKIEYTMGSGRSDSEGDNNCKSGNEDIETMLECVERTMETMLKGCVQIIKSACRHIKCHSAFSTFSCVVP